MAPRLNALDMIAKNESAWKNVKTGAWNPSTGFNMSTGGVTGPSTASGYWQITNTTWRAYAPGAGVDVSQYPTAMSAPYETQRAVAGAIYDQRGFQDWAPYNANIRADLATHGRDAYGSDSQVASNSPVAGSSGFTPAYDNFSPSGLDTSSLSAPGSFSDQSWTGSTFPDDNSLKVTVKPEGTYSGINNGQGDSGLTGDQVSSPESGSQGSPTDVPTAIVTSGNQQAQVTANAAKTTAQAALSAAKTTSEAQKAQTANETKLQSEQQEWASNWAVRIFLFIVGAIFLAGGLFLFGGQAVFSSKNA